MSFDKPSRSIPKVPLAHFYAGMIFVKTGKFDEAAREFEAELAVNPSDLQASIISATPRSHTKIRSAA